VKAGDLIRNARLSAELTQAELAERASVTQAQVSRLEAGTREPSFSTVVRLVEACGRDLSLQLYKRDVSLQRMAAHQRAIAPWERAERLFPNHDAAALRQFRDAVELVATVPGGVLLTGELASVMHGGPFVLEAPMLELVPALPRELHAVLEEHGWMTVLLGHDELQERRVEYLAPHGQANVALIARPAGTDGYRDLVRDAQTLPGVAIAVVSVRDLLRISELSTEERDRHRRLEQRAMLDLEDPANPPDLTLFTG